MGQCIGGNNVLIVSISAKRRPLPGKCEKLASIANIRQALVKKAVASWQITGMLQLFIFMPGLFKRPISRLCLTS
jgi:hypothetical protein